jgi:hypothetical protein
MARKGQWQAQTSQCLPEFLLIDQSIKNTLELGG